MSIEGNFGRPRQSQKETTPSPVPEMESTLDVLKERNAKLDAEPSRTPEQEREFKETIHSLLQK